MISIIVAINKNNGIGMNNELLYWLPNDLKRFKALTTGHTIIMGRKTFESLPKGALPNRRNIVLTRQEGLTFEGAESFGNLKKALENCKNDDEVFIIGGASLYHEAIAIADKLYITEINDCEKEADAFFPEIDKNIWEETKKECHSIDEKHSYEYSFCDYERKK